MFARVNDNRKTETGFTLVELLVVIIIIGIITAVAIPVFANQRQRAADAATIADVKNLAILAQDAMVKCGNANIFDINPTSTAHSGMTVSWTKPDGTVIGPIGTAHTLPYNYWLDHPTANVRIYDTTNPWPTCMSSSIMLSPGTNVHLSHLEGSPRGEFVIYGWNSGGKKYNGSTINMTRDTNEFPASWRNSVVTYDTRAGGIKK